MVYTVMGRLMVTITYVDLLEKHSDKIYWKCEIRPCKADYMLCQKMITYQFANPSLIWRYIWPHIYYRTSECLPIDMRYICQEQTRSVSLSQCNAKLSSQISILVFLYLETDTSLNEGRNFSENDEARCRLRRQITMN